VSFATLRLSDLSLAQRNRVRLCGLLAVTSRQAFAEIAFSDFPLLRGTTIRLLVCLYEVSAIHYIRGVGLFHWRTYNFSGVASATKQTATEDTPLDIDVDAALGLIIPAAKDLGLDDAALDHLARVISSTLSSKDMGIDADMARELIVVTAKGLGLDDNLPDNDLDILDEWFAPRWASRMRIRSFFQPEPRYANIP
jgi:hypothetical protein